MLNGEGVHYAVVGGYAAALHGHVRATKDIDILVEPTEDNVARALRALGHLPMGIAREHTAQEVVAKPLTVIGDDPRVDLITVAWSVHYADAQPGIEFLDVDGVQVPVVDIDTLIRSKRTNRPQDTADIEELERIKALNPEPPR